MPRRLMNDDDVEVGDATIVDDDSIADGPTLVPCVIVVGGPDEDGEILVMAGREAYLPRETAFKLANEILLRLKGHG